MRQFWQNNKGSISTLAIISIISVLMILFLSINIGNIYAKKNLVEDTANSIAPGLLAHQLTKYYNNSDSNPDNDISLTTTPTDVANTMLNSLTPTGKAHPLAGAEYKITFGLYDATGFHPFPTNADNPDIGTIIRNDGQDFAVRFQLKYNATPLGDILNFETISLKGDALHATNFKILEDEVTEEKKEQCCCTQVAGGTAFFFGTSCAVPNPDPKWYENDTTTCMYPFFPNPSSDCDTFYSCQGNPFLHLFSGSLFSSFLDLFKCWFDDFLDRLIKSFRKIDTVVDQIWDGAGWQTI